VIKQEKLFYVQNCVKKMLVTTNIYYIDKKKIYFIIINIYNYIFSNIY